MRVASFVPFVATLLVVAVQSQSSVDQAKPASPCDAGAYRDFDFWAGEWIVKNVSGEQVGRNTIQPEQRGCALIERWTSAEGGTGVSLNFYDPVTRAWAQQWVSPGTVLTMTGGLVDGEMVLEGPLHYLRDARATRLRGTWSRLPDGRVRQHFVESVDEGRTWTEWFDGYYSRL
jgi:hypothetical protein